MRVEQVMFRSGPVRCAGDLYLPDGVDAGAPAAGVVMGHSVVMVKEALGPHAEYLVRAGMVVLAVDWRTVRAYDRAWQPKRLELLQVDEFGLSIEPGLGQSMGVAVEFFDRHLRRAPRFVPSPTPEEAQARGLRPEYRKAS